MLKNFRTIMVLLVVLSFFFPKQVAQALPAYVEGQSTCPSHFGDADLCVTDIPGWVREEPFEKATYRRVIVTQPYQWTANFSSPIPVWIQDGSRLMISIEVPEIKLTNPLNWLGLPANKYKATVATLGYNFNYLNPNPEGLGQVGDALIIGLLLVCDINGETIPTARVSAPQPYIPLADGTWYRVEFRSTLIDIVNPEITQQPCAY